MTKSFTLVQFNTTDIVTGTVGVDNLLGTSNTDILFGLGGDDTVRGGLESDFITAGPGGDSVFGEDGDDYIFYHSTNGATEFNGFAFNNFTTPVTGIAPALDRQFLEDEWFDVLSLNAPASATDADIEVNGGNGADTAIVDLSYKNVALTVNFATDTFDADGTTYTNFETLWIRGGTSDDKLTGGANVDRLYGFNGKDTLAGADGDDFLFGGLGEDRFNGGAGDDMIVALNQYEQFERPAATSRPVDFFSGLQTIFNANAAVVSTADALISGGTGDDTAVIDFRVGGGAGVDFVLDPSTRGPVGTTGIVMEDVEAIWAIGTNSADNISGAGGSDRFLTNGGAADTFDGRGGSDWLEMGKGTGGNVNLTNNAQNSGDLAGDSYTSIENVVGSASANVITGTDGVNKLYGRGGADKLNGGDGDDFLEGGIGGDQLNGGGGIDTASYESSYLRVLVDMLNPGANTGEANGDTFSEIENLLGSRRGDTLRGNNLANAIDGGLGSDTIEGRDGDDTLTGNSGNDTITGGVGTDSVIFSGNKSDYTIVATATGFTVTDKRGANFDGTDTVTEVESFVFADQTRSVGNLLNAPPANPTLTQVGQLSEKAVAGTEVGTLAAVDPDGSPVTFSIVGGSTLFAIVGNKLVVAPGATLNFDNGSIQKLTVVASDGSLTSANTEISIKIGDVDDRILGTEGADTLEGTAAADVMVALGGADIIKGSDGADSIDGGAGIDTMLYTAAVIFNLGKPSESTGQAKGDTYTGIEIFKFSAGSDDIFGSDAANTFFGGAGSDTIEGGGGSDKLLGEGGKDTIEGGAGKDSITGGRGGDTLTGDAGGDSFIFLSALDRGDTITDFSSTEKDRIKLSKSGFDFDVGFKITLNKTLIVDDVPKATGTGDVFLFDTDTGVLVFDSNGKTAGGRTTLVTLTDVDTLKASDFILFA